MTKQKDKNKFNLIEIFVKKAKTRFILTKNDNVFVFLNIS